jgi:hypothetical protein
MVINHKEKAHNILTLWITNSTECPKIHEPHGEMQYKFYFFYYYAYFL